MGKFIVLAESDLMFIRPPIQGSTLSLAYAEVRRLSTQPGLCFAHAAFQSYPDRVKTLVLRYTLRLPPCLLN